MRLFIAVDLGEEILAGAAEQLRRLSKRAPQARWARAENLHLTLVFLGERDEALLPALRSAMEAVGARHGPVRLEAGGGGAFGSSKHPGSSGAASPEISGPWPKSRPTSPRPWFPWATSLSCATSAPT